MPANTTYITYIIHGLSTILLVYLMDCHKILFQVC